MIFAHLRDRDIPSYNSEEATDPFALIFVVKDTKDDEGKVPSESEILQASTFALIDLLLNNDEIVMSSVEEWLEGRIRKIVKRARNTAWDKTSDAGVPFFESSYGNATVRAFAPIRFSEQPPALKKLQVSGLQADDTDIPVDIKTPYLSIQVDKELGMSTGKLVAQVGHAVQLFIMYAEGSDVNDWLQSGSLISVSKVDVLDEFDADVAVHDAGFTEVANGSLTCTATYIK